MRRRINGPQRATTFTRSRAGVLIKLKASCVHLWRAPTDRTRGDAHAARQSRRPADQVWRLSPAEGSPDRGVDRPGRARYALRRISAPVLAPDPAFIAVGQAAQ